MTVVKGGSGSGGRDLVEITYSIYSKIGEYNF